MDIEVELGKLLQDRNLTLGTVESATGGLIAFLVTRVSGSSQYFKGSIVSYDNDVKSRVVGVRRETLDKYGAVSAEVAEEMAAGGRRLLDVDICVADTGIAGPTGATQEKPVGLFYLGFSSKDGSFSRRHVFNGDREENRSAAAQVALSWVKEYLTS